MRPLDITDINDIEEDDMIAFQRTNKDGTTVSLLGFVSRIQLSKDKTEIESLELLPMAPSNEAPNLKDVNAYQVFEEKDLQCSGLDVPHTVYGMSFKVTPEEFENGTTPRLGYLHQKVAQKICDFADDEQEVSPNYFNLHPDVVAGIGFPSLQARIRHERPTPRTNHEQATPPRSGVNLPWKKTIVYDYKPVEAGGEQPDIIGNPWEDFDFK